MKISKTSQILTALFFSKLISQRSILLLGVIDITPKKQILNKKLIIEAHQ